MSVAATPRRPQLFLLAFAFRVGLPNEALNDRGHVGRPRLNELGFVRAHGVLPILRVAVRNAAQLEYFAFGLRQNLLTCGGSFDCRVDTDVQFKPASKCTGG
jgi:hypothetical protein